jgi:hypothetical protein
MIISFHIIIYCHPAMCCKLLMSPLNKPLVSEQNAQIYYKSCSSAMHHSYFNQGQKFVLSGTLHLHEILELALILDILTLVLHCSPQPLCINT